MKKIYYIITIMFLLGISGTTFASKPIVDFKVNGQKGSLSVQKGDVLNITWTSSGAVGCSGTGSYGDFTIESKEWATHQLPASGNAQVVVSNAISSLASIQLYCWDQEWVTLGGADRVTLTYVNVLNPNLGTLPAGPQPIITNLTPTSGAVGTKIQINGTGFSNKNSIIFVGSTNPVSGADNSTLSPIDGEVVFTDIASLNGKTLSFTIPSTITQSGEKPGAGTKNVVPGTYYIVVQNDNGKSGVSYLRVNKTGDTSTFTPIATTVLINQNISLGSYGPEVVKLQKILSKDPTIYPSGLVTGYFGFATQKAVQKFQCKYKITCSGTPNTTGYGYVGLKTRFQIEKFSNE